ncbi:preprotein translocase subunit YajC [Clostridium sp. 19966]|uniref:preprotein translocase subunit YajC n=1 Tax=Clostridium sp. 19966 TaxID=2768166 RepID=UPI0028DD997F|nr:preprotein translocase subunit YajC [Clostridium sp. 19966]MDT8717469.1 preprotein translocase subunit YajC [Clostridium sp. 19966]
MSGDVFKGIVIPFIIMIALFYLMVFLPESRRRKKYNTMLSSVASNDEVLTKGGIIGKVVNVQDDYIIIQTGPDRSRLKVSKNGIAEILNSKSEESK